MKALTLWQPWATLIAIGAKQYETRSWGTSYRGPLAIHAGVRRPTHEDISVLWDAQVLCPRERPELAAALERVAPSSTAPAALPLGVIVATCRLVECVRMSLIPPPVDLEAAVGDWSSGRFAWRLEDVVPRLDPALVKGARGLWEWNSHG